MRTLMSKEQTIMLVNYIFKSACSNDQLTIKAAPLTFYTKEPIIIDGVTYFLIKTEL